MNPAEGAAGIRGLGDFLVESHDWLRGELAELQQQVAELVTADAHEPAALPPCPSLTHGIRAHCSEFCSALWHHHTGETTGAFPLLAERFPGLDRVLRQLADEHRIVARIQGDIAQLVENYRPGTGDPATLAAHLHSLAQELENHFAYEEQSIVAALNALGPAPTDIP
nr:hemerythrin domain-containing protein [Nocardia sp. CNY236]